MSSKRVKMSHAKEEEEVPSASLSDLPNDLLKHCFSFIPEQYITVAPVSRQFFTNYCTQGMDDSTAMSSADSLLKIGQNKRTTVDAVSNDVNLTQYAFLNHAPEKFMYKVCQKAALKGRTDMLECAHAFGIEFSKLIWYDGFLLDKLAEEGNLEMLQYFDSTELIEEKIVDYLWAGCFEIAVESRHLHILKWIFEVKFQSLHSSTYSEIDLSMQSAIEAHEYVLEGITAPEVTYQLCKMASRYGNIEVLEHCHRNNYEFDDDQMMCCYSMENKDKEQALMTLKWLRLHDCPWDESLCEAAASNENFEALKWARSEGCPWNEETLQEAAERGNIEIIEYCLQNECPMSKDLYFSAISIKDHDVALKVLKLLHKYSCPWDEGTCTRAILEGNFEAMLWAKRSGCPWTLRTFASLVASGNLSILEQVLQDNPLHEESMFIEIRGKVKMNPVVARAIDDVIFHTGIGKDYLDKRIVQTLKFLLKHGYEWNAQTTAQAAKYGKLRVLQWLRYMGCPMDADCCVGAVESENIEILKYVHGIAGCRLSKEAYACCLSLSGFHLHGRSIPTTVKDSHKELLEYLEKNECPKPDDSDWRRW